METDPNPSRKASGRPRDRRIDEAVRAATTDLLLEVGYQALTLGAVAERAGTSKTALYRRWSNKAELVHEAAFPSAPAAWPLPAGPLEADIHTMVAAARDLFLRPVVRAALPGLIADVTADPDLYQRVLSRYTALFDVLRARYGAAVDTGAADPGIDPERIAELIGGAALLRMFLAAPGGLDDEWVRQTAALVVSGIRGNPNSPAETAGESA